ncbi:MAG: LysM domain-containing protein [Nitriliruptorales bacterium]|nr:LysM domain-containing protein [Nitriliruptorales bacterium]
MRSRSILLALLALDLVGLTLLHDLGQHSWTRLDPAAPPEDAIMALLRLVALAAGWWLAGSTLLYAVARLARARRLAAALRRSMLPAARRLVEASLAATLAVGPTAGAYAEEAIPPVVAVEPAPGDAAGLLPPVMVPPRGVQGPSTPRPQVAPPRHRHGHGHGHGHTERARPQPSPPTPTAPSSPRLEGPRDEATPTHEASPTHVVQRGEHLWSIAAHTVDDPRPETIARYWRRLVDLNRDRLSSNDPDLLYPGEVLLLPPSEGI